MGKLEDKMKSMLKKRKSRKEPRAKDLLQSRMVQKQIFNPYTGKKTTKSGLREFEDKMKRKGLSDMLVSAPAESTKRSSPMDREVYPKSFIAGGVDVKKHRRGGKITDYQKPQTEGKYTGAPGSGGYTKKEKELIDSIIKGSWTVKRDDQALKAVGTRRKIHKMKYTPSEKTKLKAEISKNKKKQEGGYLQGPSHDDGGMAAVIGGEEPVELEGGEYIIRKSSVDKIGKENLAKINEEGRIPTMARGGDTYWKGITGASKQKEPVDEKVERLKKENDPNYKPKGAPKTAIELAYERDARITAEKEKKKPRKVTPRTHAVGSLEYKKMKKEEREDLKRKEVSKKLLKGKSLGTKSYVWEMEKDKRKETQAKQIKDPGKGKPYKTVKVAGETKTFNSKAEFEKYVVSGQQLRDKHAQAFYVPKKEDKKVVDKKPTYSGQKTYDAQGNVVSSTSTNKVDKVDKTPKVKKDAWRVMQSDARKSYYDEKGWKYDDTIKGYNRDGTKKVVSPVQGKRKTPEGYKVPKEPLVLAPKKDKPKTKKTKEEDAGWGVFGSKKAQEKAQGTDFTKKRDEEAQQEILSSKRKVVKKKTPLTYNQKVAKALKDKDASEKRQLKSKKWKPGSLIKGALQKLKDLKKKKGKSPFEKGSYQTGGPLPMRPDQVNPANPMTPTSPIPAAPPFRQGMKMMGHGGVTSTHSPEAAGGDPIAVHSHSGYKAGE